MFEFHSAADRLQIANVLGHTSVGHGTGNCSVFYTVLAIRLRTRYRFKLSHDRIVHQALLKRPQTERSKVVPR
eukprot:g2977.t1